MRIARKLVVPTLALIGLITVGLMAYNTVASSRQFDELEQEKLDEMHQTFLYSIQSREDLALALASQVANTPAVQAAFAARDRDKLLELTLSQYKLMRDEFDISQEQFHLPPATSFLRLHSLENYGDDLSDVRPTIVQANRNQEVVSGLGIGRAGIGIRGVVPVFYENEHIGALEFGNNIEEDLVEELQNNFGYDWQILITRDAAAVVTLIDFEERTELANDRFFVYASTLPKPLFSTSASYDEILDGENAYVHVKDEKRHYTILSAPLRDFSGAVIGSIDIISDHTKVVKARNQQLLFYGVVLSSTFLLVGIGFSVVTRRTLHPLETLVSAASALGGGDFSQRIKVISDDEIGALAQSFNAMTGHLRTLVGTLEQRTRDLERHADYLNASTKVGHTAASLLEPEQLMRQVVELIREQFGLYYVGLFLVDATGEWAELHAGTGEAGQAMLSRGHRLRVGKGMIGWSVANAEARIALDVGEDAVRFDNPNLPATRSEGALPLRSRGQTIGALTVQSDQPAAFDEATIAVLQTMADQVAVAIDNARLFTEAQEALKAARRAYGEIGREAWSDLLRTRAHWGYRYVHQSVTAAERIERPEMLRAERSGQSVQGAGEEGPTLVVPIKARDQVIGTLRFRKGDASKLWTPAETTLLEALTAQLSVALESARLYEDSQQRAAREQLVGEITARMRESLSVETILSTAVREIGTSLGLAGVNIRLSEADEQ
ncbi:MAG: cache domain-containing protein [Chloroflexota bacterium]|nr:cache domain-containing protein [Chloroflexota bacterium]